MLQDVHYADLVTNLGWQKNIGNCDKYPLDNFFSVYLLPLLLLPTPDELGGEGLVGVLVHNLIINWCMYWLV